MKHRRTFSHTVDLLLPDEDFEIGGSRVKRSPDLRLGFGGTGFGGKRRRGSVDSTGAEVDGGTSKGLAPPSENDALDECS